MRPYSAVWSALGDVGTVCDGTGDGARLLPVDPGVPGLEGGDCDGVFIMEKTLEVWRSSFTDFLLKCVSRDRGCVRTPENLCRCVAYTYPGQDSMRRTSSRLSSSVLVGLLSVNVQPRALGPLVAPPRRLGRAGAGASTGIASNNV